MPFRKMLWLFPIAVTLHNSEEALWMPKWTAMHSGELPFHPGAAKIRVGLLVATLAAFGVTYASMLKGRQSLWAYLLFGYVTAMLVNVFVPHIPATLVFRTYTPGIVTAVLINLPAMSILLFKAVRENWVSGMKAIVYALLVPLAIAGAITALFTLS